MEVFEITSLATGVSQAGVNYLQPTDSYETIENGFIYRQVLQSRMGIGYIAPRLDDESRVFGIFEYIQPDGTKELLAIDQNFLYSFNTGTGVFDQIPFGGSLAPVGNEYAGFAISAKDFYISGNAYPDADNNPRFVFCGRGIGNQLPDTTPIDSTIFFYDGTEVLCYTDTTDNTDYADPPIGALTSAEFVTWFNGRINFMIPTIASTSYQQMVLYSGIQDASGNGDKFNVAGAGDISANTQEPLEGFKILGQIISLHYERSNYSLEKTTDAFNPYFIRKVPSVLGTDAKFSPVQWGQEIRSLGKTGVLSTDGRQTLRADNKIPYFTADQLDQIDFNLTYGGFDRINNQFLWAYKESEADTQTQNKVLVNNYEEDTWSVYDLRLSVLGQTDVGLNLTWDDIDETSGNESWAQWDTTEELWDRIGLGAETQKTLAGDDLGFIYQLNQDFDDYFVNITGVTNANAAVLTVSPSAFQVGDRVTVSGVQGVADINNFDPSDPQSNLTYKPYIVTASTDTTVTTNFNSTDKGTYSSGGTLSKVISFRAKTIPFNPWRNKGMRIFVSHVEFLIDTNGGNLRFDCFADEEEYAVVKDVLLYPTELEKKREWITVIVDEEANFFTFQMRQESPSTQVKVTSIRIHAAPGGMTSG